VQNKKNETEEEEENKMTVSVQTQHLFENKLRHNRRTGIESRSLEGREGEDGDDDASKNFVLECTGLFSFYFIERTP